MLFAPVVAKPNHRRVAAILQDMGLKVAAIRHPMPYGDLVKQKVQRFATYADLDLHECTIEEREEYEPHLDNGVLVFAGVDYEAILREAEKEVDVVLWDGGNNDFPFYKTDLLITVVDPCAPVTSWLIIPVKLTPAWLTLSSLTKLTPLTATILFVFAKMSTLSTPMLSSLKVPPNLR